MQVTQSSVRIWDHHHPGDPEQFDRSVKHFTMSAAFPIKGVDGFESLAELTIINVGTGVNPIVVMATGPYETRARAEEIWIRYVKTGPKLSGKSALQVCTDLTEWLSQQ